MAEPPQLIAAQRTSGLAIASLVLGVIGFVLGMISLLFIVMPILAIVFGFVALSGIRKDPQLTGRGYAIAGIILGFAGLILPIILVIGALAYFGVLSPNNILPTRCMTPAGLDCIEAPVISAGSISFKVANNMGEDITITGIDGDPTGDCVDSYDFNDISMQDGSNAVLTYIPARKFKPGETVRCKLNIAYVQGASQVQHKLSAEITGKVG